jgi:hypothetical protein
MIPRKLYVTNKHGARVRLEHERICSICPYGDNKTCTYCAFNAVNILGVKAAFSPKESYRKAHADDISASPLMQKLDKPLGIDYGMGNNAVLPRVKMPFFPVPTFNSMSQSLNKLQAARKRLG